MLLFAKQMDCEQLTQSSAYWMFSFFLILFLFSFRSFVSLLRFSCSSLFSRVAVLLLLLMVLLLWIKYVRLVILACAVQHTMLYCLQQNAETRYQCVFTCSIVLIQLLFCFIWNGSRIYKWLLLLLHFFPTTPSPQTSRCNTKSYAKDHCECANPLLFCSCSLIFNAIQPFEWENKLSVREWLDVNWSK